MSRKRLVLALLFSTAFLILACGKKEEVPVQPVRTVQGVGTETVEPSSVAVDYEAIGTLRSKMTTVLSSKILGQITAVNVREGDIVRSGQLLIEIDARDIKAQLLKAQAGLREGIEAVEEIERNAQATEAAQNAAEANRVLTNATFIRYRDLLERRSVSQQEFEEVEARNKVAEAELDRIQKGLDALGAKKKQVIARMDQAKAEVSHAEILLGYSRITSPISGIVVQKGSEPGMLAAPGTPLLTLEDQTQYRLEVSVEESQVGNIRMGAPVHIRIDALEIKDVPARVTEIVPSVDPSSRTYLVRIDLPETGKTKNRRPVRSGLYGKARFVTGEKQNLLIPPSSVIRRGQLTSVYVVGDGGFVQTRLIQTGKLYGDRIEVLSGLNKGEKIIIQGIEKVSEGNRIQ